MTTWQPGGVEAARPWLAGAVVGLVAIIALLGANTTKADAADQQVGDPIRGAGAQHFLGQAVDMSADGTRVAATSRSGIVSSYQLFVYEFRAGAWTPLGEPPSRELAHPPKFKMSSDGSSVVMGTTSSVSDRVSVYHYNNGEWRRRGPALSGGDEFAFGSAVAINDDGTRIAATSRGAVLGNVVRVFDLIGGDWVEVGMATTTTPVGLGESLEMSADGTRLVVNVDSGTAGGLLVFEETDAGWRQVGEMISSTLADERLGRVVSMSDDGTRVAARGLRSPDDLQAYHVTVYAESEGTWSQLGNRLTGEPRTGTRPNGDDDNFGKSLSLSGDGNRLAIGAPGTGHNGIKSGSLSVYELDDATWQPLASFVGPRWSAAMGIGVALDRDGSRVVTSSPNADAGANNAGQLTVFGLGVPAKLCGGKEATLVGTSGNDRLIGTPENDVILGLGGNDVIKGLDGDDVICAGYGNDTVYGGQGFDTIFGAQGDDVIFSADHATDTGRRDSRGGRILAGAGDDTIHGSNRWDRIRGGPGNDTMFGYEGRDWMRGGPGPDDIDGGTMVDDLHGGDGNDVIFVLGNDRVRGGAGANDRCVISEGSMPWLISCEVR